jgi:hypothetical protein
VPVGVSARRSPPQARVAREVENQIVVLSGGRKVVAGVVDDVVGAERTDEVELGGTGDAGDLRAERLGDLYRVAANPARCADHQHSLPRLKTTVVGQCLEGGRARDRHHRGLLEREAHRLLSKFVRPGHGILGERPAAHPVHLVPDCELSHPGPDGGYVARQISPGHPVPRSPEAEAGDPHQVGLAGHQVPRAAVEASRVHPNQNLLVADVRASDALVSQDINCAVAVLHDGLHLAGLRRPPLSCGAWCASLRRAIHGGSRVGGCQVAKDSGHHPWRTM